MRLFAESMPQQPFGFANMIARVDWYTDSGPHEVVVIGPREIADSDDAAPATRAVAICQTARCRSSHRDDDAAFPRSCKASRRWDAATVYVCHRMTCSVPVTSWDALEPLLQ